MSLADSFERAGVVVGSMLLVALPLSLVLQAFVGASFPWWSLLVLLGPGFVVGWGIAFEHVGFDYDTLWFVCVAGYFLATIALGALDWMPPEADPLPVVAVLVASLGVAAAVDYVR